MGCNDIEHYIVQLPLHLTLSHVTMLEGMPSIRVTIIQSSGYPLRECIAQPQPLAALPPAVYYPFPTVLFPTHMCDTHRRP